MRAFTLSLGVLLGCAGSAGADPLDLVQFQGLAIWEVMPDPAGQYSNTNQGSGVNSTPTSHAGQTDAGLLDNAGRGGPIAFARASFFSEVVVDGGHVRRFDGALGLDINATSAAPLANTTLNMAVKMDVSFELTQATSYELIFDPGFPPGDDLRVTFGTADAMGALDQVITDTSGTLQPGRYAIGMDVFSPFFNVPLDLDTNPVSLSGSFTLLLPSPASLTCIAGAGLLAGRRRRR